MTRRNSSVDPVFSPDNPLVSPGGVRPWLQVLPQPIALTGATGFVGSHLVDTLCAAGIRPRALVRNAGAPRWIAGRPVDWVEGSLEDPDALDRLVDGAGVVMHLAGVLRGANEDDFLAGNRDGTMRLIASVERHSPEARFVHISSQAAVGPADAERGAAVDADPRPISAYGRSKAAAEGVVRDFGGWWAILRPPAIFGPRDTDIFEFFRMASRGLLAAPSGERRLTIAHVADVVRAVIAVAAVGRAKGIYHVGAAKGMLMEAMLREIADSGDVRARMVRIPPWILKTAGAGASGLRMLGLRRIPLSRDKAGEILAKHWVLETKTSIERLGLPDPVAFDQGARMTWQWYRNAGWLE
ncbi:MAG: NAD-dependent epimerase/dehydratase family protein [Acidobacteriota bacterium]